METSPKEDAEIEFNECHCLARFKDEIEVLTEAKVTDEDLKKVKTVLLADLEKYNLVEFFTVILSKSEREKMRMGE
jgi:C4-type Zn-finger protein